ncbi:isoprenoid synthase domain-containing protein [Amylostereum chailletii]|nr:isoprenoid synthase domain-containing protein [Amylostereum chailletii]
MSILSTTSTSDAACVSSSMSKEEWSTTVDSDIICGVVRDLIRRLQWDPLPDEVDERLEAAILDTVSSWDLSDQIRRSLLGAVPVAVYMSSMSYAQDFDFERKLLIALLDLCLIHVDNATHAMFDACEAFVPRLLARQPQLDPVLEHLAALLPRLSEFYHPFVTSAMSTSALHYVSACCIEDRASEVPVSASSVAWPWDFRKMTGIAPLFGHAIFPLATFPDVTAYLQAMPDIEYFINMLNDVLSFYKEEMAHETANYIRADSLARGLTPTQALVQCAEDTINEHDRAVKILSEAHTGAADLVAAWKAFVRGYIGFHVHSKRYLLAPLLHAGADAQD